MFKLMEDKGVLLRKGLKVHIDPARSSKADKVLISHAHSDHARVPKKSAAEFMLTPETLSLLEGSFSAKHKVRPIPFDKKVDFGEFDLSLHNAGHILGAAQCHFQAGQSITVTNDFKMQDSVLFKAAEPLPCDTLIVETTFGLPEFSFPAREKVYEQIGKWVKANEKANRFTVLAGYNLGKAQELTKVVNEFAGVTPLVYDRIFDFNEKYGAAGVKLGDYIKLNHNLNDSNVLILPPQLVDFALFEFLGHATGKKVVSGFSSGWKYRNCFDELFCLSDHADFEQLMKYIEMAQPKRVFTMHGFDKEFAHYVSRHLKIPAQALSEYKQKNLLEFNG